MTEARIDTPVPRGVTSLFDTAAEWFVLVEDGQATEQELRAFGDWLLADTRHADAYDAVERSWHQAAALSHNDVEFEAEASRATSMSGRRSHRPIVRAGLPLAAAASVVLAALVVFNSRPDGQEVAIVNPAHHQTAIGEVRKIELTDGSQVTLGPDSEISVVPFAKSASLRQVQLLSGEAFFDVADDPSAPFEVRTGQIVIRVTGTAFDVQRKNGAAEVAVAEGSVRVSTTQRYSDSNRESLPAGTSVVLGEGQRVVAKQSGNFSAVAKIPVDRIGAWRRQRLVYSDAPLRQIVADLKRYQQIDVAIGDEQAARLRVTGMFDSNDIDAVLASITELLPVDIVYADDGSVELRSRD
ncbi:MAG: FecR domain-containing protein [Pseudomonadota bacterium]